MVDTRRDRGLQMPRPRVDEQDLAGGHRKGSEGKFSMTPFPTNADTRVQILDKFLHGQARHEHLGLVDPLQQSQAEDSEESSRIRDYASSRNSCDGNSSSRMSPYLASGIVSARMCLNKARALTNGKLESGRDSGIGMWVQEVSRYDVWLAIQSDTIIRLQVAWR